MKSTTRPPGKRPRKGTARQEPAASEATQDPRDVSGDKARDVSGDKDRESADKPSEEEVISHWKDPVTNQDEQEKITNNGGDDIPVANN